MTAPAARSSALRWADVRDALLSYARALSSAEEELNELNLFPVADHDTGSNLAATMAGVADALDDADSMEDVLRAMVTGSMMAARGSSGLILAEYLRGLGSALEGAPSVGATELRRGLSIAAAAARTAMAEPADGTMVSVADAMAGAATKARARTPADVLRAAHEAAATAVDRSSHVRAVTGGRPDAGAKGLSLLPGAFLTPAAPDGIGAHHASRVREPARVRELVLVLAATERASAGVRAQWEALGDSVVVTGGGGTYTFHVHTDRVDDAIAAASRRGMVLETRVEPLPESSGSTGTGGVSA